MLKRDWILKGNIRVPVLNQKPIGVLFANDVPDEKDIKRLQLNTVPNQGEFLTFDTVAFFRVESVYHLPDGYGIYIVVTKVCEI